MNITLLSQDVQCIIFVNVQYMHIFTVDVWCITYWHYKHETHCFMQNDIFRFLKFFFTASSCTYVSWYLISHSRRIKTAMIFFLSHFALCLFPHLIKCASLIIFLLFFFVNFSHFQILLQNLGDNFNQNMIQSVLWWKGFRFM